MRSLSVGARHLIRDWTGALGPHGPDVQVAAFTEPSAGAGTHRNLDAIVDITTEAIATIGNAGHASSAILIDHATPSQCMRVEITCTIPCATTATDARVVASVTAMISAVSRYVPGYRLVQPPHSDRGPDHDPPITVLLEVAGAADYLPAYAGNLDIITAAAVQVGELLVGQDTSRGTFGVHAECVAT